MKISNKERDIFKKKKSKKLPFLLLFGTLTASGYYYVDEHDLNLSNVYSFETGTFNMLDGSNSNNKIGEISDNNSKFGFLERKIDEKVIVLESSSQDVEKNDNRSTHYFLDNNTEKIEEITVENKGNLKAENSENICGFTSSFRVVDDNLDIGSISKNISYGINKNNSKIISSYVCLDEEKMLMDDFKSFCYNKGLEGELDCFRVLSKLSRDEKERKSYQKLYDH